MRIVQSAMRGGGTTNHLGKLLICELNEQVQTDKKD